MVIITPQNEVEFINNHFKFVTVFIHINCIIMAIIFQFVIIAFIKTEFFYFVNYMVIIIIAIINTLALMDTNLFIAQMSLTKNFINFHKIIISKLNFIFSTNSRANINHHNY